MSLVPARTTVGDAARAPRGGFAPGLLLVMLLMAGPVPLSAQVPTAQVPRVAVATVGSLQQAAPHRAPAEVVPAHRSVLASETTAVILRVAADVGATVAKGELLVELDPADARLLLAQADAQLAAARANATLARQRLERGRELGARSFISQDELLALDTTLAAAKAEAAVAKAARAVAARALEKTRVRAPFAGTVSSRSAQQGALAVPGTPLVTLVSTSVPELSAAVPAALAVGLGTARTLAFKGEDGARAVSLLRLVDAIERTSRTREARLAFDGEAPLPGTTGTLVWTSGQGALPAALLVRRNGTLGVFQVVDGVARFVPVPGAEEGRAFSHALPADALLVSEGQDRLQDGAAVEAIGE